MTPITRKELYLNKIVGNNDYETPEKPITEEEFFFAEILGEAVQAPEPLTRYQMYLAKIAGKDVEIPYPETRLEYFLAKAAGMEIETPTPITREEIFWSNYHAIVDFEVEGIPPLTYKAVASALKDYKICGNTISGESVGDLVETGEHAGEYRVPVTVTGKNLLINKAKTKTINGVKFTVNDDGSVTCNGFTNELIRFNILALRDSGHGSVSGNFIINGSPGVDGTLMKLWVDDLELPITSEDVTYNGTVKRLCIQINENTTVNDVTFFPMIRNVNIEDGTFEPYQIPVTTNIYLPEQIKMVGDEAEYIDYEEQKQHRVRKNLIQNTATSRTYAAGITLTVNNDKSVVVDGTSTTGAPIGIILGGNIIIGKGTYTLSGCPQGGSNNTYKVICIFDDNGERKVITDNGNGATVVLNNDDAKIISNGFYISALSCDNNTFYPMLRKADIEDNTYEPYIENTELDVTLPDLPTLSGTNTLSVGTVVQPSKVYVKGEKEREYT